MKGITMLILLMSIPFFAYADDEVTITTYHPSPYGSYRNLQLYPGNQPTAGVERGLMYYNQSTKDIMFYNGTDWNVAGKYYTESYSWGFLRNYHNFVPAGTFVTTTDLMSTIAACNRRCGAGCTSAMANCNGNQPGLGFHGGTAVEWNPTSIICECF